MANDLMIPMGEGKMAAPAHIAARFKPEESNILAGDRMPTLSIKGKVFTMTVNGETTPLMKPDEDGNLFPMSSLGVIVLDYGARMGRSYYETAFDPDQIKEPTCYSLDGIVPEDDCEQKQSDKCATCPMAVKGSKVSDGGKATTACAQHRILAVVPSGDLKIAPLRLRIAQTSNYDGRSPDLKAKGLFAFQNYLDYIRARGIPHTQSIVTQLSFDPNVAFPKLLFKAVKYVTEEQVAKIDEIVEGGKVGDILGATGTMSLKSVPASQAPKNVVALPGPSAETLARRASEAVGKANVETAKVVMDDEEEELKRLLAAAQAKKKAALEAAQAPKGPTPEEIAAKAAADQARAEAERVEAKRIQAEEEAKAKAERMAKLKAELEASVAAEAEPEPEDEEAALMRQLAEARARKAGGTAAAPAAVAQPVAEAPKRTRRSKEQIAADEAAKAGAKDGEILPPETVTVKGAEIKVGEKFLPNAVGTLDDGSEGGEFVEATTVASKPSAKSTAKVNEAVPAVALSSDVENLLTTWDD